MWDVPLAGWSYEAVVETGIVDIASGHGDDHWDQTPHGRRELTFIAHEVFD